MEKVNNPSAIHRLSCKHANFDVHYDPKPGPGAVVDPLRADERLAYTWYHVDCSRDDKLQYFYNARALDFFYKGALGKIWRNQATSSSFRLASSEEADIEKTIKEVFFSREERIFEYNKDGVPSWSKAFVDISRLGGSDAKAVLQNYYVHYLNSAIIKEYSDTFTVAVELDFVKYWFEEVEGYPAYKVKYKTDTTNFRLSLNSKSKAMLDYLNKLLLSMHQGSELDDCLPSINCCETLITELGKIAKSFIVAKYGKDVCSHFQPKKLQDIFAMFYFPTQPGLLFVSKKFHKDDIKFLKLCEKGNFNLSKVDPLSLDTESLNLFRDVFDNRVPKQIFRYFLCWPYNLISYISLKESGIQDDNLIYPVLEMLTAQELSLNICDAPFQDLVTNLKKLGVSEKRILHVLSADLLYGYQAYDACNMFNKYWEQLGKSNRAVQCMLKTGLSKETHDMLTAETNKIRKPNRSFELTEEQIRRYEHEIDGFNFRLAKNTHELVDIGEAMSICVGSYDDRVLNKQCLIVYAEKDGLYRLCIEVRDRWPKSKVVKNSGNGLAGITLLPVYESRIWQCRMKCNKDPEGPELEAFNKWLKKTKSKFSGNSY